MSSIGRIQYLKRDENNSNFKRKVLSSTIQDRKNAADFGYSDINQIDLNLYGQYKLSIPGWVHGPISRGVVHLGLVTWFQTYTVTNFKLSSTEYTPM